MGYLRRWSLHHIRIKITSPNEVKGPWIDSGSKVMIVSSSLAHTALDMFKLLNCSPEDALSRMIG